jgi:hypothetical protein
MTGSNLCDILFKQRFILKNTFLHFMNEAVEYRFIMNEPKDVNSNSSDEASLTNNHSNMVHGRLEIKRLTEITNINTNTNNINHDEIIVVNEFRLYQNSPYTATFEFTSIHQMTQLIPISFTATLSYNAENVPIWKIREPKSKILKTMTLTAAPTLHNAGISPLTLLANMMEVEFRPVIQMEFKQDSDSNNNNNNKPRYNWVMTIASTFLTFHFSKSSPYIQNNHQLYQ